MTQIKSKELLIKEMLARYKHYKLKDETAEFWREMKAIRAAVESIVRKERKLAVRSKLKDHIGKDIWLRTMGSDFGKKGVLIEVRRKYVQVRLADGEWLYPIGHIDFSPPSKTERRLNSALS